MSLTVQVLSDADLKNADAILNSAFQRTESRIEDLCVYRGTQSDGWFLASLNGSPVGVVGTKVYGDFAYVGSMAVHRGAQRQGVGFALMQHVLTWLDHRRVPLVLLDASEVGQGLYEKLGFIAHDRTYVFRYRGITRSHETDRSVSILSARDAAELAAWDAETFGAARADVFEALLAAYPRRAVILHDEHDRIAGYLFAQSNRIGPWVARRSRNAEVLLQTALSWPYDSAVSVVVPELNRSAMDLLTRYGFEIVRTNRHMSRGSNTGSRKRENIYGQTSLGMG